MREKRETTRAPKEAAAPPRQAGINQTAASAESMAHDQAMLALALNGAGMLLGRLGEVIVNGTAASASADVARIGAVALLYKECSATEAVLTASIEAQVEMFELHCEAYTEMGAQNVEMLKDINATLVQLATALAPVALVAMEAKREQAVARRLTEERKLRNVGGRKVTIEEVNEEDLPDDVREKLKKMRESEKPPSNGSAH